LISPASIFLVAAASVAIAGCGYLLLAGRLVRRFADRATSVALDLPTVTLLKPLHGDETGLYDNLAGLCRQSYRSRLQIVLGVQSGADSALPVAQRLKAAFPEHAIDLVVDGRRRGRNAKVSNLANMAEHIRHDVVILSDSDIQVGPDYVARVVGALADPAVAGVTCLYHGVPVSRGLWPQLSALAVDVHFLPAVVVGLATGRARPCFGSTIAFRRADLEAIGGFAAVADVLADDYALGEKLRERGQVVVPPFTVGHVCPERTPAALWHHELRWARTVRTIDPLGHLGSVVTHPLPFALAWLAMAPGRLALAAVAAAIACRIALCVRMERAFGLGRRAYWLLPLRDCLSFAVFVASFLGRDVRWKSHDYGVAPDGSLAQDRRPTPP
jgi:ceramide glucosyltransferase